ncbi:MAG: ribonuclease T [Erythrobacter sp.]
MSKMMRFLARLIAILAFTLPALANAQAYQCRAPLVSSVPKITPNGKRRTMPVTGYTLALSWSPAFCRTREGSPRHRMQCSGDYGRFGLVVHGLWPNGGRSWPQWCAARTQPTPADIRRNLCIMPSVSLAARQWAKHGSCMVKKPATYFKVTRILWNGLRIPDYDRISREDSLTAGRIRQALADANKGWFKNAIGVKLNKDGWLEEVRLCYAKNFMPKACDKGRYGARDGVKAKIWRGL